MHAITGRHTNRSVHGDQRATYVLAFIQNHSVQHSLHRDSDACNTRGTIHQYFRGLGVWVVGGCSTTRSSAGHAHNQHHVRKWHTSLYRCCVRREGIFGPRYSKKDIFGDCIPKEGQIFLTNWYQPDTSWHRGDVGDGEIVDVVSQQRTVRRTSDRSS